MSALLTQEALREFVERAGLLLFAPRPQLAGVPAPTVVEATLGRSVVTPSLAEAGEARILIARLIADGSAVALNLLGAPTTTAENPDFIAASTVFPYIFTLRGDKLWKQPPANSGATKVSPLAINAFTLLAEQGPRSAPDLAAELGKGLTEAAVLRALSELWQHLRVLPVPQADGAPALWETAATRFTKQIKAGANAGQPSALSALVSLYLGQAMLATEDEIATFLSPLAARTRVRDVLHALSAAQQLESMTIEGKQYVHLAGELPHFGDAVPTNTEAVHTDAGESNVELADDGSRIKTYKPRKTGTGFIARPKPFGKGAAPERERRPFVRLQDRPERSTGAPRAGASREQQRVPARGRGKQEAAGPRPSFARPWDEERVRRTGESASRFASKGRPPKAPASNEHDVSAAASAGSYVPRKAFTSRPAFGERARTSGGERTAYSKRSGFSAAGAREPARSPGGASRFAGGGAKPSRFGSAESRSSLPRPGGFSKGRPASGSSGFRSREQGAEERSPRPYRAERPASRGGPGSREGSRDFGSASRTERPIQDRRTAGNGPREVRSSRPPAEFSRPAGKYGDRRAAGAPAFKRFDAPRGPKRPFKPEGSWTGPTREASSGAAGDRPRPFTPRAQVERGDRRASPASSRPPRSGSSGFRGGKPERVAGARTRNDHPARDFAVTPRSGASAGGGGTFDKFKGGNKPWGKRPPARKAKPVEEES